MQSTSSFAVKAENVSLYFGKNENKEKVLDGLYLRVPTGSVCCLIGPSGCGKTSLLRCVIGFITPTSGSITLFGFRPGESGSGIPGSNVGYMPQDIDLNNDLTIEEMLAYFGRLFRMDRKTLKQRIDELVRILALSDKTKLIGNLSDGQKRRVCFAATIVHKPKLAILDEPTVGVDPLLREVIWNHLNYLQKKNNTTFVITTHYIEESKRSNYVAFMRNGTLIACDSPSNFVDKYKLQNLEDIFAKLCLESKNEDGKCQEMIACDVNDLKSEIKVEMNRNTFENEMRMFFTVIHRIIQRVCKKKHFFVLFFLFEIIEFLVFISCYGQTPFDLNVGIVCEDNNLYSKRFIDEINANQLNVKKLASFGSAKEAVKRRIIHGFIHLKRNFSETIFRRLMYDSSLTEEEVGQSSILFVGDFVNQVITATITRSLYISYRKFAEKILIEHNYDPKYAISPVIVDEIVFGEIDNNDFFGTKQVTSPQMLVYFRFVHSVQISIFSLLHERSEKIFERNFSAGVSTTKMIAAHFLVNFLLSGITALPFLLTSIHLFGIKCEGSFFILYCLTILQIASGVATGMFYSTLLNSLPLVTILSVGLQFSSLFISGAIWPHESLPYFMKPLRYLVSFAIPNESVLSVTTKALPLRHPQVLKGFLYSFVYILILSFATKSLFKY